jgi:hypothetical protein
MSNYFETLNSINCAAHVEKKGKFSYLSWPFAVAELRKRHPTATWEVIRFNGMPFLETPAGVFVEVAVTVEDVTLSQIHPVLNGQNKPIGAPTSFDINTSIQRCLVKAISLHGLGLYIYAGEDLPEEERIEKKAKEKEEEKEKKTKEAELSDFASYLVQCNDEGRQLEAIKAWYALESWAEDVAEANEDRLAVWGMLRDYSALRSAIKANKPEAA